MHRKSYSRLGLVFIASALLLATGITQAERGAAVQLESDRAEMSQATGIGVYTGNVELTHGDTIIRGDRMTVHTSQNREIERVVVEGEPANFVRAREGQQEPIRGYAPRMEYHATAPEHVRLLQGARLVQGTNEFTGETIHYDLTEERVAAEGAGERRTRITFFPRQDENAEGEDE
ncbi:lipopolysaccharide transport periplasmic protein LptA [Alkalilimnicola ehrlichii]|uniref:Lipopolysaccharide export system protein LptA n=1 Tax=Alkalilimnicola ehrlichii TaxID=351052 RepID=A0A3E0X117_9GAMM|nr:lipopolysaccharide transport periplasmic protein LptA [Alkalilimnicola ehrlichii]RFA30288.1 lipopolysaccharide transport periplasmic protein LptA [Alkalilimnicola ehrlichii]RFA37867.1 lipopolysaccharide transport periplasmic protein LptA [Alkalilimnicola ehrlichii]